MKRLIVSTLLIAVALSYAFSSLATGRIGFWLAIGGAYLVTTALALHKMWDDGTLLDVFQPRWGDISIGVLLATLLAAGVWLGHTALNTPGSAGQVWMARIYFQLAAAPILSRHTVLTIAIIAIAVLEEISWRGFIQRLLEERFGTRRGWIYAALLYALVHVPTAFALRDPTFGVDPLLALAALGAGLCWSFAMRLIGRLPPLLISHALFAYFALYQLSRIF